MRLDVWYNFFIKHVDGSRIVPQLPYYWDELTFFVHWRADSHLTICFFDITPKLQVSFKPPTLQATHTLLALPGPSLSQTCSVFTRRQPRHPYPITRTAGSPSYSPASSKRPNPSTAPNASPTPSTSLPNSTPSSSTSKTCPSGPSATSSGSTRSHV